MAEDTVLGWLKFATVALESPDWRRQLRLGSVSAGTFEAERKQLSNDLTNAGYLISAKMLAGRVSSGTGTFSVWIPASWWQHLRHSMPRRYISLSWVKRWRYRHPVRMTESKVIVDVTRHLGYPLADVPLPPDDFGYPVIYDQLLWNVERDNRWTYNFQSDPDIRYAPRYAIAHKIENVLVQREHYSVITVLTLLAQLGVNPDQLVEQSALDATRLRDD